ncbi:hypothetical protein ACFPME_07540 [Rhodanobacter umsongensis]|uniref:Uncharacterized protein n=1 Tax=Rhodanobacter umsongensis TaxID=633153 RepID=A0ABW0JL09_9GAMM
MPKLSFHSPRFDPFAVEGTRAPGPKGVAAGAARDETDPDWQPM